jgi:hypothetical protein
MSRSSGFWPEAVGQGARVEIWQTDVQGRYLHAADRNRSPREMGPQIGYGDLSFLRPCDDPIQMLSIRMSAFTRISDVEFVIRPP